MTTTAPRSTDPAMVDALTGPMSRWLRTLADTGRTVPEALALLDQAAKRAAAAMTELAAALPDDHVSEDDGYPHTHHMGMLAMRHTHRSGDRPHGHHGWRYGPPPDATDG